MLNYFINHVIEIINFSIRMLLYSTSKWCRRVLILVAILTVAPAPATLQVNSRQEPLVQQLIDNGYTQDGALEGGSLVEWTAPAASLWEKSGAAPLLVYRAKDGLPAFRSLVVVANEILITVTADDAKKLERQRISSKAAGLWEIADATPDGKILLIRYPGPERVTPQKVYERFRRESGIDPISAEPNQLGRLDDAQDRQYERSDQPWPHRNRGGAGAKVDADVDGNEALARLPLAIPQGPHSRSPIVMVIDTGFDVTHPALQGTLWQNSAETPGDGIDNDNNGYRDDVNGWNFAANNSVLFDPDGHGTHVSGIITARPVPGNGAIRGSAPGSTIMVGKVSVQLQLPEVIKALQYAKTKAASVVSMSFTFEAHSPAMTQALVDLENAGVIAVAAAGNAPPGSVGRDLRITPTYPCMNATVVCVGASDQQDKIAPFSHYGASFGPLGQAGVAITAPGVDVLSTVPGGYGTKSGTSMATPMVSAAMASTWRLFPTATHVEIRNRVLQTADRVTSIPADRIEEGRRLNLYQAFFSKAPRSEYAIDDYCNELVYDATNHQYYRRYTNSPFANSGEPGIDGNSFGGAYTICTVAQMASIQGEFLDGFFLLKKSLNWKADVTGAWSTAIGDRDTPAGIFNGVLDGNGFIIENFDQGLKQNAGLIARLGPRGHVTNLRFTNVNLRASNVAAVVSPSVVGGRIYNVQAEGQIIAPSGGGIAGSMLSGAEIRNSVFEGLLDTKHTTGGIAASAVGQTLIANCYFSGTIMSLLQAGGIAGVMDGAARIEKSHANVTMPAPESGKRVISGGLVGYLWCRSTITDSFAEGEIAASETSGGLVGRITNADIRQGYSAVFFPSDLTTTGGAIGQIADGILGDNGKYRCTESTTVKPPISTRRDDFFDQFQGGVGIGTPKSPTALRTNATFASWRDEFWDKVPGTMPRLKRLPRTTHANY